MNTRLLIDAIVRQTTVLVAQLSTAAGIRAPLSHVADEVFLSLSQEIEAHGVGRKVAADMFGLALRAYQKKVQRLSESATFLERSLWETVHDHIAERGNVSRRELLARFARDGEREVVGVLTDLVGSGLVHVAGRGAAAVYGPTTDAERRALVETEDADSLAAVAWALVRGARDSTTASLASALRIDPSGARSLVARLEREGRLSKEGDGDDARLSAAPLVIPVGAEMGWEAAVFDHFRAVASAIAAKIRTGGARSAADDTEGGATLSFVVAPEHPLRERVRGLLARTRAEVNALWHEVEAHNERHPAPEKDRERVWFYMGQYIEDGESEDRK